MKDKVDQQVAQSPPCPSTRPRQAGHSGGNAKLRVCPSARRAIESAREIPSVNIAGIFKESILAHDPEKWIPIFGRDHAPPLLAHDPEKWIPVFGRDHAPPMNLEWSDGSDSHTLADYRGCDAEASRQSGFG